MPKQLDLFIALPADMPAKNGQDLMARAWFSLSKRKRMKPIEHRIGEDFVKVLPTEKGMATVWDQDFIMFVISQWIEAINKQIITLDSREKLTKLSFNPYDYMRWKGIKRPSGKHYQEFRASIDRLASTYIETSLQVDERTRITQGFNWITYWTLEEDKISDANMTVHLPDFIWNVVKRKNILTIDDAYFSITGGLERFLYLYCRKAAGSGDWLEGFESIYEKSAAVELPKRFTARLRGIIERQSIPQYHLSEETSKAGKPQLRIRRLDSIKEITG